MMFSENKRLASSVRKTLCYKCQYHKLFRQKATFAESRAQSPIEDCLSKHDTIRSRHELGSELKFGRLGNSISTTEASPCSQERPLICAIDELHHCWPRNNLCDSRSIKLKKKRGRLNVNALQKILWDATKIPAHDIINTAKPTALRSSAMILQ